MARIALTQQQTKVLTFVEGHLAGNGFPPTIREIGRAVGLININAVRGHLTALEKKGYITKEPDKARSIRVLYPPSALSRFRSKLHEIARTDEGVISRMVYGLAWTTAGGRLWHQGFVATTDVSLLDELVEQMLSEHQMKQA